MATLDIVIPVLNEEHSLPGCIDTLIDFLDAEMSRYQWRIVVADNGSTDATLEVAQAYASQSDRVGYIHLDQRGRGRALKRAWSESNADVVSYMDVDLSTDLAAFPALIGAIVDEGYDVATGSRLMRASRTTRSLKRESISRAYNLLIKAVHWTHLSDAQCGFKALGRAPADAVLPLIVDNHWFFDTELLLIAEKRGFRIKELPVTWREDPDTRVKIASTALEDIKGLLRLRFGGIPQVKRQG